MVEKGKQNNLGIREIENLELVDRVHEFYFTNLSWPWPVSNIMMIINNDANEDIILIAISEKGKEKLKEFLATNQILEFLWNTTQYIFIWVSNSANPS